MGGIKTTYQLQRKIIELYLCAVRGVNFSQGLTSAIHLNHDLLLLTYGAIDISNDCFF